MSPVKHNRGFYVEQFNEWTPCSSTYRGCYYCQSVTKLFGSCHASWLRPVIEDASLQSRSPSCCLFLPADSQWLTPLSALLPSSHMSASFYFFLICLLIAPLRRCEEGGAYWWIVFCTLISLIIQWFCTTDCERVTAEPDSACWIKSPLWTTCWLWARWEFTHFILNVQRFAS